MLSSFSMSWRALHIHSHRFAPRCVHSFDMSAQNANYYSSMIGMRRRSEMARIVWKSGLRSVNIVPLGATFRKRKTPAKLSRKDHEYPHDLLGRDHY